LSEPKDYYKFDGKYYLIEIKIDRWEQFFDSLDPAPLKLKKLNSDSEFYLVEATKNFPLKTPLTIAIHLPEALQTERESVRQAIVDYFGYKQLTATRELNRGLFRGYISLSIGFVFLFVCLSGSKFIGQQTETVASDILAEGLSIVGWVAMWRPLENLLYDWWAIHRLERIYHKLASTNISFELIDN
jgi:hypothetical protein